MEDQRRRLKSTAENSYSPCDYFHGDLHSKMTVSKTPKFGRKKQNIQTDVGQKKGTKKARPGSVRSRKNTNIGDIAAFYPNLVFPPPPICPPSSYHRPEEPSISSHSTVQFFVDLGGRKEGTTMSDQPQPEPQPQPGGGGGDANGREEGAEDQQRGKGKKKGRRPTRCVFRICRCGAKLSEDADPEDTLCLLCLSDKVKKEGQRRQRQQQKQKDEGPDPGDDDGQGGAGRAKNGGGGEPGGGKGAGKRSAPGNGSKGADGDKPQAARKKFKKRTSAPGEDPQDEEDSDPDQEPVAGPSSAAQATDSADDEDEEWKRLEDEEFASSVIGKAVQAATEALFRHITEKQREEHVEPIATIADLHSPDLLERLAEMANKSLEASRAKIAQILKDLDFPAGDPEDEASFSRKSTVKMLTVDEDLGEKIATGKTSAAEVYGMLAEVAVEGVQVVDDHLRPAEDSEEKPAGLEGRKTIAEAPGSQEPKDVPEAQPQEQPKPTPAQKQELPSAKDSHKKEQIQEQKPQTKKRPAEDALSMPSLEGSPRTSPESETPEDVAAATSKKPEEKPRSEAARKEVQQPQAKTGGAKQKDSKNPPKKLAEKKKKDGSLEAKKAKKQEASTSAQGAKPKAVDSRRKSGSKDEPKTPKTSTGSPQLGGRSPLEENLSISPKTDSGKKKTTPTSSGKKTGSSPASPVVKSPLSSKTTVAAAVDKENKTKE